MKSSDPSYRVLVLAASEYQLPVIQEAKWLGYYVVTADNVPENPGHRLADRNYFVSTTETAAILALARQERIDGIIAACTDVAVPTAASVGEQLNLVAPPIGCAEILCNKINFRAFQREHGLPSPEYRIVSADWDELNLAIRERSWVVKPAISSGSKGIRIVNQVDDLPFALAEAQRYSLNRQVLMEEFIPGQQGTAEGFLVDGELRAFYVFDRQTAPAPYTTTWGHIVPATVSTKALAELKRQLLQCFALLGYRNGPFDCDFIVSPANELYLLEITPRIGGNSIIRLLMNAYEFPIVTYALQQCVGQTVDCRQEPLRQPTAVLILGVEESGTLSYDWQDVQKLEEEPWVAYLQLDKHPGEAVEPFINGRYRIGEVIITGTSLEELHANIAQFRKRLDLQVVTAETKDVGFES